MMNDSHFAVSEKTKCFFFVRYSVYNGKDSKVAEINKNKTKSNIGNIFQELNYEFQLGSQSKWKRYSIRGEMLKNDRDLFNKKNEVQINVQALNVCTSRDVCFCI